MTRLAQSNVTGQPVQSIYPGTTQVVSFDGAVASANAFADDTSVVRIVATTNCNYRIGKTPVAAVTDPYLPAGVIEYPNVARGDKISFIKATGSTAGTAWVTEGA